MTYLTKAALAALVSVACGALEPEPQAQWQPSYAPVAGLRNDALPLNIAVSSEALEAMGGVPGDVDAALGLVCTVSEGQWCPGWFLGGQGESTVWVAAMTEAEQAAKGLPEGKWSAGDALTFGGGASGRVRLYGPALATCDAAAVLAHELLHVAGLEHQDDTGIMRAVNAWWPSVPSEEIDAARALWTKARAEAPVQTK